MRTISKYLLVTEAENEALSESMFDSLFDA
jgi:hypothetical protein